MKKFVYMLVWIREILYDVINIGELYICLMDIVKEN